MNLVFKILAIFFLIACSSQVPLRKNQEQRTAGPRETKSSYNNHIILFSHMDLGWIYTIDQYYKGTNSQEGGCVRCVFRNVLGSLSKENSSNRRYIIAEVGFFQMWWNEIDETNRTALKTAIEKGNIEFVNGGWTANDEACAYYEDIADNFIVGLRWLKENLGIQPRHGWQIDSFGHSKAHAGLLAELGFESLFFGRIDFQDWEKRRADQNLEFNWRPFPNSNKSILGRLLHNHYSDTSYIVKDNFSCRSIFCHGNLKEYELGKLQAYLDQISLQTKTPNVMQLVGDDFHLWQQSEKDFVGIENQNSYINSVFPHINSFSSNLSYYVESIKKTLQPGDLKSKTDDFFPYVEYPDVSWSGYFTSKPGFKYYIKKASKYYNAAKLILTEALIKNGFQRFEEVNAALAKLEEALAVTQHHDAVSGTNKEKVRIDYENRLDEGMKEVQKMINGLVFDDLLEDLSEKVEYTYSFYDPVISNSSLLHPFSNDKPKGFFAYNPGYQREFMIKIRVAEGNFKIVDQANEPIHFDMFCMRNGECDIYFRDLIPAYSFKVYKLSKSDTSKLIEPEDITKRYTFSIHEDVTFTIDENLETFEYKLCKDIDHFKINIQAGNDLCISDIFSLTYMFYVGEGQSKGSQNPASGAYIFNPKGTEKTNIEPLKARIYKGSLMTIIYIQRNGIDMMIKFDHNDLQKGFEVETIREGNQKDAVETVLFYKSTEILDPNIVFYTDTNGYFTQRRQKDYRETYEPKTNMEIQNNYYPIIAFSYIQDPNTQKRMTINTDRAQGMSSLGEGEMEIMIHRYTTHDDFRGLAEALMDKQELRAQHWFSLSNENNGFEHIHRLRQYEVDRALQLQFFDTETDTFAEPISYEFKHVDVSPFIKIYMRSYKKNEIIIKFHNQDEKNSYKINLADINTGISPLLVAFSEKSDIKVQKIDELGLSTVELRKDLKPNYFDVDQPVYEEPANFNNLTLEPLEFRTFSMVIETPEFPKP